MSNKTYKLENRHVRAVRRLFVIIVSLMLFVIFVIWRADSERAEVIRINIIETLSPVLKITHGPANAIKRLGNVLQGYERLHSENEELRNEIRQMQIWREAAIQLEQKNAQLLALNKVQIDPSINYVTGVVKTDSASPFQKSVLINLGKRNGILDGWAVMDGLGLIGRISGVGNNSSRVLLLTDINSRIPVIITSSGQRALLNGDHSSLPLLTFFERSEKINIGDRVITSGDGGVFPPDILIGQVIKGTDNRLRVRLFSDLSRLKYVRVLRTEKPETIPQSEQLLGLSPNEAVLQ